MGCLGKLFKGCFIFFLLFILLIGLFIGLLFSHRLFGVKYDLNEDKTSYTLSEYGIWNGKDSFSIPEKHLGKPVTKIKESAFSFSELTSITIPKTITTIENGAFEDCYDLTSITVDENNTKYKSVDGNLYTKDGKVLIQYASGKDATHFSIPDGVTEIGAGAFDCCEHLIGISIPDSVTTIGANAFYYCYNLVGVVVPTSVKEISYYSFNWIKIYYKGTAEEWNAINVSDSDFFPTDFDLMFYSETKPTEEGNYWHYDANGKVAVWQ